MAHGRAVLDHIYSTVQNKKLHVFSYDEIKYEYSPTSICDSCQFQFTCSIFLLPYMTITIFFSRTFLSMDKRNPTKAVPGFNQISMNSGAQDGIGKQTILLFDEAISCHNNIEERYCYGHGKKFLFFAGLITIKLLRIL
ncbi:hypothetical protein ACJX0J_035672 [Zea mays]